MCERVSLARVTQGLSEGCCTVSGSQVKMQGNQDEGKTTGHPLPILWAPGNPPPGPLGDPRRAETSFLASPVKWGLGGRVLLDLEKRI